jgi:hydroxyacylglutathione hydrolase
VFLGELGEGGGVRGPVLSAEVSLPAARSERFKEREERMETEIRRVSSLGMVNSYLVKQEGLILVDTGLPKVGSYKGMNLKKALKSLSSEPGDIRLILITHGHYDHIGLLSDLKTLTGAKVAVSQHEREWVEKGLRPLPKAVTLWGRMLLAYEKMSLGWMKVSPTKVDIVLEDKAFSLQPFGIHGKVIYTPGHSPGSVSLILDTGEAFVGDLTMNGLPFRIGPGMPIMADDVAAVRVSWRTVLDNGAKTIYPAHGKPFQAEVLRKLL